jgi:hypothetical protein
MIERCSTRMRRASTGVVVMLAAKPIHRLMAGVD